MVDITQKPYFSYNDIIDTLSVPIRNHAEVQLGWFSRVFKNGERFLIVRDQKWALDYFAIKKLYEHGFFERNFQDMPEGYHMWDHLPYAPPEVYGYAKEIGIAHGLTIGTKNDDYCDFFSFSTHPGNNQVNNFYLNQKPLFSTFMEDFYRTMVATLVDLSTQTFWVPINTKLITSPIMTLSPRQLDCARLLSIGSTTKEIAFKLELSPWTVEEHINILKTKLGVKNRPELVGSLMKIL